MATAEEFRRLAQALEGTTEAPHVDRTAFRVVRICATLAPDGAMANLRLAPDEEELKCLAEPAAFAPVPNRWGAGLDRRAPRRCRSSGTRSSAPRGTRSRAG